MAELSKKKVLKVALGVVAFLVVIFTLLFAYVSNSRPKCPMCRALDQIVFSWKMYKLDAQPHEVRTIGMFGTCEHCVEKGGDNRNRFAWYCKRCKIHVIKPPNWRSE